MYYIAPLEISNSFYIVWATMYLPPGRREALFNDVKNNLTRLITNSYRFKSLLEFCTPDQRTIAFNALEDKLPELINDAFEFQNVLHYLDPTQRTSVFNTFKEKLPEFINSIYELSAICKYLNEDQRKFVLESIRDKLPILNRSCQQRPLEIFSPEEKTFLSQNGINITIENTDYIQKDATFLPMYQKAPSSLATNLALDNSAHGVDALRSKTLFLGN